MSLISVYSFSLLLSLLAISCWIQLPFVFNGISLLLFVECVPQRMLVFWCYCPCLGNLTSRTTDQILGHWIFEPMDRDHGTLEHCIIAEGQSIHRALEAATENFWTEDSSSMLNKYLNMMERWKKETKSGPNSDSAGSVRWGTEPTVATGNERKK